MTLRPDLQLERLHHVPIPEPDGVRMQATIAAAEIRFANAARREDPARRPASYRVWGAWLTGALAIAATGFYLLPDPPIAPVTPVMDTAEVQAPTPPAVTAPPLEPAPVLGARQPGSDQQAPMVFGEAEQTRRFGPVEIVARTAPGQVTLALIRDGKEKVFELRPLSGSDFDVLDAFVLPQGAGRKLLLLRSRLDGEASWNAYALEDGTVRRSLPLPRRVQAAPDRLAVIAALAYAQ